MKFLILMALLTCLCVVGCKPQDGCRPGDGHNHRQSQSFRYPSSSITVNPPTQRPVERESIELPNLRESIGVIH